MGAYVDGLAASPSRSGVDARGVDRAVGVALRQFDPAAGALSVKNEAVTSNCLSCREVLG